MKVLTVDDNPMTGILLGETVREFGHTPFLADDAAAAMVVFERERPEICILDWMMPGTDGLQLACAIRQHPGGAGVYIMMLSAKTNLESIGLAYELGVDDFISKPVAPGEIRAQLLTASRLIGLREDCAEKRREIAALAARLESQGLAA